MSTVEPTFLKNYSIYFSGAMVVAFFNYLFYPVLAHFLSVPEFGEVQVIVSLFTEFAVITGALSIAVLHIVASPGEVGEKARTISELKKIVRWGALALSGLLALFSLPLSGFFHFDSAFPFLAFALLLFVSTLPLFGNAYLQGKLLYIKTSLSSSIGSIGRIVLGLALVLAGFGVVGVVVGIALSQLLVWLYVSHQTKEVSELASAEEVDVTTIEKPDVIRELRYTALVLLVNISLTILYTVDVLFVKHYFDTTTAGLYAGVSAIAKIGYFALAPLATVILPSVAADTLSRHRSLKTALTVYFSLAVLGLMTSYIFRGIIVSVLFGTRYLPLSNLLPLVTLLMCAIAFAQVFASYFLALRQWILLAIVPVATFVGLVCAYLWRASIAGIVLGLLTGTLCTILGLILLYAKDYFNHRPAV